MAVGLMGVTPNPKTSSGGKGSEPGNRTFWFSPLILAPYAPPPILTSTPRNARASSRVLKEHL